MEQPTPASRRPLARSALLLLLVVLAAVLVQVRGGTVRQREQGRWAYLSRRAGDTYVYLSYLSLGAARPRAEVEFFQGLAVAQYRLAQQAGPSDLRATMSAALALQALERSGEARETLRRALRDTHRRGDQRRLRLLLNGPLADKPHLADLDAARETSADLAPAATVFADAYAAAGDAGTGQRLWDRALTRARTLQPTLVAVLVVLVTILTAGLVGLLLGVRMVFRPQSAAALLGRGPPPAEWRGRDALEGLLVFVLLQLLLGALVAGFHATPRADFYLVLGSSVLSGLLAVAWVRLTATPGARLGWHLRLPARQFLVGLVAGGAMVPPALLLTWAMTTLFRLPPQEQALVPVFTGATDLPARVFLVLSACAIIPVVEETLFRGLLYGALRRYFAPGLATLISAAIFAGGHWTLAGFLSLALVGVVLAWLYERTGSLLAPAVAHAVVNAWSIALLVLIYR